MKLCPGLGSKIRLLVNQHYVWDIEQYPKAYRVHGSLAPPYILHKKETNLLQFCQISSSPGNSQRKMMSGKVRFHIEKFIKLVI